MQALASQWGYHLNTVQQSSWSGLLPVAAEATWILKKRNLQQGDPHYVDWHCVPGMHCINSAGKERVFT
jgi:hypothetical protein